MEPAGSASYASHCDRGPVTFQYSPLDKDVAVGTLSQYVNSQRYDPSLSLARKERMMAMLAELAVVKAVVAHKLSTEGWNATDPRE